MSKNMFGASKGDTTNNTSTTDNKTELQKNYIDKAINLYGAELGQNDKVYQGQRVADFTDLQNKVFDFADNGGFVRTPEQTDSYFASVIKNPFLKNYNEVTNPAVKEAFSGPGYWGSGRAAAEAKSGQDLADNLNSQYAQLRWDVDEANKQGAQQQMSLGSMQQQQQQNQIAASMQKFTEENQITDPQNLSVLMSLLGMNLQSTTTGEQSTTTPSWKTGDWMEWGGNIGQQAGQSMQSSGK
jgi:hypothetical protein